ncbi:hypothetical protein D9758_000312 [Tetrapyrgos nigripes]|uniref:D-serine dehydratase n=1 Tax=Tetrapyrgos nigripes TaxID=182062 RepID=A0A8H5LZ63_9AGAR|nr:hypothetical protein D9758_000312 [Tetrapyrgos nigripes]
MPQTKTPYHLANLPSKVALVEEFVGKSLDELRTPAFVIDRAVFASNCANMHKKAKEWGAGFRVHLKTHKTAEGTRLQLQSSVDKTSAVVVSTMMEAWEVVNAGLFKDGTVSDILYGIPPAANKIADLSNLQDEIAPQGGVLRLMIDHPDQVKFLEKIESERQTPRKWSVFVKVDGGQKRAGVPPTSPLFESLVTTLFTSSVISVYGFYIHAGNAYASTSFDQASSFLSSEVDNVNTAAGHALKLLNETLKMEPPSQPFVLSVGSTPTAHAATAETRARLSEVLHGSLELHAGNYPMLDLQQESTNLIDPSRIAQRVLVTVLSYYEGRGVDGSDEALVDGGAIAFSKDTGPSKDFGRVVGKGWRLGRISQEHGTLTRSGPVGNDKLRLGEVVEIVGQHACLIAAAYPWYYIVEDSRVVQDVWVPWKGW